jgi:hypothetical protein
MGTRLLGHAATVVAYALLPVTILAVVVYPLGVPFSIMCVQPITVHNASPEALHLTLVGTFKGGRKARPPIYAWRFIWPAYRDKDRFVPPGGEVTIYYDYDDILLTEIVLRSDRHGLRQFSAGEHWGGESGYSATKKERFVIDRPEDLAPASVPVVAALEPPSLGPRFTIFMAVGVANLFLLRACRRWRSRSPS